MRQVVLADPDFIAGEPLILDVLKHLLDQLVIGTEPYPAADDCLDQRIMALRDFRPNDHPERTSDFIQGTLESYSVENADRILVKRY